MTDHFVDTNKMVPTCATCARGQFYIIDVGWWLCRNWEAGDYNQRVPESHGCGKWSPRKEEGDADLCR